MKVYVVGCYGEIPEEEGIQLYGFGFTDKAKADAIIRLLYKGGYEAIFVDPPISPRWFEGGKPWRVVGEGTAITRCDEYGALRFDEFQRLNLIETWTATLVNDDDTDTEVHGGWRVTVIAKSEDEATDLARKLWSDYRLTTDLPPGSD